MSENQSERVLCVLAEHTKQFEQILGVLAEHTKRFDGIDGRLDEVEAGFKNLQEQASRTVGYLARIEGTFREGFQEHEERIAAIEERFVPLPRPTRKR